MIISGNTVTVSGRLVWELQPVEMSKKAIESQSLFLLFFFWFVIKYLCDLKYSES